MAKVFTITEGLENLGALKTGGQGSVYKGRRMGEIVTAIKLLPTPIHSESDHDKNFIAFQNEVQKLKKVNEEPNANVVKIINSGITDSGNFPYIEMEFIEGPDLEELLKPPHDPVFTIKEVLKVADHLSCALAHCHKAGVRHGDIKSNNVKYNVSNGNYVLLDFGLSVMSDEQRRTSIRHAGAIEFMAPEQNEGQMLFQTDVYSFGVVLFELLSGKVPFPLNDKGETGRNAVMVSHLEAVPPDVLSLRGQSLPDGWDSQKKKDEMEVPHWLMHSIYKCLEKKPEDRFANGFDLYRYIREHTIHIENNSKFNNEAIGILENENKRLRREKELLEKQLSNYQKSGNKSTNETGDKQKSFKLVSSTFHPGKKTLLSLVVLIVLSLSGYLLTNNKQAERFSTQGRGVVGEYNVITPQAFLYKEPNENTKNIPFTLAEGEAIKAYDEKNNFIYTEIKNEKGVVSRGWLRKQDLITAKEWIKRDNSGDLSTENDEVRGQLHVARQFISSAKIVEALIIYNGLVKQGVPEAMYEYGKLALQNSNENITCSEAFNLIKEAGNKGYRPAKRTLGFLYSFAGDRQKLEQNDYYNRCTFTRNLSLGSKLLMEATLEGDTAASRLLDELNAK